MNKKRILYIILQLIEGPIVSLVLTITTKNMDMFKSFLYVIIVPIIYQIIIWIASRFSFKEYKYQEYKTYGTYSLLISFFVVFMITGQGLLASILGACIYTFPLYFALSLIMAGFGSLGTASSSSSSGLGDVAYSQKAYDGETDLLFNKNGELVGRKKKGNGDYEIIEDANGRQVGTSRKGNGNYNIIEDENGHQIGTSRKGNGDYNIIEDKNGHRVGISRNGNLGTMYEDENGNSKL